MKISVIILTWNCLDATKRCVESILPTLGDAELIFVDNGSTDGTVEYLNSVRHPIARKIFNQTNLGYAKAVNLGLQLATPGADIVLLNNDAIIETADWLARLNRTAYSSADVGIVGAKIFRQDGTLQHLGAYIPTETLWGQQVAGGERDINQYPEIRRVESVVFACVYLKRNLIEAIGQLDDSYFAYFEDTDYCLRARAAGFQTLVDPGVVVTHAENSSTRGNKVDFQAIFQKSRETFKAKWSGKLRSERYRSGVDWRSIINFPTGYAATSREILVGLEQSAILNGNGVGAAYKYAYGEGTPFPVSEPHGTDNYLLNEIASRPFGESPIQVVYAQADVFARNSGVYKIGYSMLETTGIPKGWVEQCMQMNEVWVPSDFNAETFASSGVTVPIRVMPLGVDSNYFHPNVKHKRFSHKFTFLSVFEWGERKAPEILLKAFSDEFDKSEEVCLVCKINNFDPSIAVGNEIAKLGLRTGGAEIVILHNRITRREEMPMFYAAADAFVLPTRGEGWGMPILEAMACGLPTIATNWSAQTQFMSSADTYLLQTDGLIPAEAKCPYYEGFFWAQPSYQHLRHLMRSVFENQDEARVRGYLASERVRKNFSLENTVACVQNRILNLSESL